MVRTNTLPPLRILLFRHPNCVEARPYEDALVRGFQGGKEAGAYVSAGSELGIQLEIFSAAPNFAPGVVMDAFCHTLLVILIGEEFLKGDPGLYQWLSVCHHHISGSGGRHGMLAVAFSERFGKDFASRVGLENDEVRLAQDFGELAIRGAMVALRAIHEARVLLARTLPSSGSEPAGHLRLFISHAKLDGLPLAHALKHLIQTTGWLRTYYDVEDLAQNADWHRALEQGVGSSLIIMLRTEAYDNRYWCQQEVLWADEYATPAVLVEARTGLDHSGGLLPYDRIPTVRIPDGNLMRILYIALREGLRFQIFTRRIHTMLESGDLPAGATLHTFSFQPSMAALLRACRLIAGKPSPRYILYPDPVLGTGAYEAARALVAVEAPGTILATPETLTVAAV